MTQGILTENFNSYRNQWITKIREEYPIFEKESVVESAAPAYAHSVGPINWIFWLRIRYILAYLETKKNVENVLDFGCGLGILLPKLKVLSKHVYATDLDIDMCKKFQESMNFKDIFLTENFKTIENKETKFDIILAIDVLEHIPNLDETILNFVDKLTPSGELVICGPTENLLYKTGRIFTGFKSLYKKFEHRSDSSNPHHHINVYDIEATALSLGLQINPITQLFPFLPIFKIFSIKKPNA